MPAAVSSSRAEGGCARFGRVAGKLAGNLPFFRNERRCRGGSCANSSHGRRRALDGSEAGMAGAAPA